ncbi:hypothetical protein M1466_01295 [Candidatus Dependentiae bacterium]|nr:hypothetical protein [Candidatus Dependentiae bacterium]
MQLCYFLLSIAVITQLLSNNNSQEPTHSPATPIRCQFARNDYLAVAGEIAMAATQIIAAYTDGNAVDQQLSNLQEEATAIQQQYADDYQYAHSNSYCKERIESLHTDIATLAQTINKRGKVQPAIGNELHRIGQEFTKTAFVYTVLPATPAYSVGAKADENLVCRSHIGTTIPAIMGGMKLIAPAPARRRVLEE